MLISILTPTYNRIKELPNLYESLVKNYKTFKDFEWVIIDDGSADNTKDLVKKWQNISPFPIKYYYQSNQGKMMALNNGMMKVKGDLIVEVDSDDYMTNKALKMIKDKYPLIKDDKDIYGLIFNRITPDVNVMGTPFIEEGPSKVFDMFFKNGVSGDKTMAIKKEYRQKFFHKLENGEKFITEGRLYHAMDLKYPKGLYAVNEPAVYCEYLEGGYTKNINKIFKKYPFGYFKYYQEMFNFNFKNMPFKQRLHIIKHYLLFGYLTKQKVFDLIKLTKGSLNKLLVLILLIPSRIKTKKWLRNH